MPRSSPRTITLTELGMRATDLIYAGVLPPAPDVARPAAKLTSAQAAEIWDQVAAGARRVEVAARFGVSRTAVDQIMRGETWRGVGDE